MQGSYTRGIDPNYASKVSIPVPKIADDGKRSRSKNQKWKLRTKVGFPDIWVSSRRSRVPVGHWRLTPTNKDLGSWEVPLSEGDKSFVLLPTYKSLLLRKPWHRLLDEWNSLGCPPQWSRSAALKSSKWRFQRLGTESATPRIPLCPGNPHISRALESAALE